MRASARFKLRRMTVNCAPGQLRDATTGRCGPGVGVNIPRKEMPQIRGDDLQAFLTYARETGVPVIEEQVIADDLSPTQREFRQERIDAIPDDKLKDPILVSRDDYILDGTHRWIKQWQANKWAKVNVLRIDLDLQPALKLMRSFPKTVYAENVLTVNAKKVKRTSPLKYDPTRTVTLRRAFRAKLRRQFSALKVAVMKLVGDEDAFGIGTTRNTRWQYESDPDAVAKFQEWLKTQLKATVRSRTSDQLWDAYIQAGFKKGVARSFDDYTRSHPDWKDEKLDFYAGSRKQFLESSFRQPVSRDRVKILAGRTFDELENVTTDMSTKMSRVLIDGLIAGKGRREVADDLVRVVGLAETRANTIAQTECLLAETLVDAAMVRAVFRRWYEGPVVEVETRFGRKFTATPNHPMLTQQGWVAAGILQEGDYLVCDGRQQDPGAGGNPDIKQGPTQISELFRSFNDVGILERKLGCQKDFHGDGMNGDVDVLTGDGLLRVGRNPSLYQPVTDDPLPPPDKMIGAPFCSQCRGLLPVDQSICLCCGAQGNSPLLKSRLDYVTIRAQLFGNSTKGFPVGIPPNDIVNVNVGAELVSNPPIDPSLELRLGVRSANPSSLQDGTDPFLVAPLLSSNLSLGQTGLVQFDDVKSVTFRQFSGHVYNLETEQGYYTIDRLYSGNCIRAHAEGQLVSLDQLGVEELGVMVEWSTAGDSAVCDECQPLEGVVLKMDEAQGMIPRHPNCRCAWMPANVGEDKSDQTRTKSDIGAAIKESRGKDDDWGPGKAISKDRPVSQVKNRRPEPTWEEAQEEDEWRRVGGPPDSLDRLSRFLTDNYNPDQARDESGRWSTGGAGTTKIPMKEVKRLDREAEEKSHEPMTPAEMEAQSEEYAAIMEGRYIPPPDPLSLPGRTMFHGTSSLYVAAIMKHGLVPQGQTGADVVAKIAGNRVHEFAIGDRAASVYLTESLEDAGDYSGKVSGLVDRKLKGKEKETYRNEPVILTVNIPPTHTHLVEQDEKSFLPDGKTPNPHAVRFRGRIPPEWIKEVESTQDKLDMGYNAETRTVYLVVIPKEVNDVLTDNAFCPTGEGGGVDPTEIKS